MNRFINDEFAYPYLKVHQSFGTFYACSIPARELLLLCQPVRAEALDDEIENDPLDFSLNKSTGTQRERIKKRPEQIRDYIQTGVAAFPNSIIIGANISEDGFLKDEDEWDWKIAGDKLVVSAGALKASIIDGQHRLAGYELLDKDDPRLEDNLLCSIYLNIPMTYHAQLFSIINSTQRKVHKNLIYQLYQIDMDSKKPQYWSPDVLAVYLVRGLGSDKNSMLNGRIVLAIDNGDLKGKWTVSLSSLVEAVIRFISANPHNDRDLFYSQKMETYERKQLPLDNSPWRKLYLENKDKRIYEYLLKIINTAYDVFGEDTAYTSSIGSTAILEALRSLIEKNPQYTDTIIHDLKRCLLGVKLDELPSEKVTKNKSLLRDVIIASVCKFSNEQISYKFRGKELVDFDLYLKG